MPELPEVETYRKYLIQNWVGKKIITIKVFLVKALKNQSATQFNQKLLDQKLEAIQRHGKYLVLLFDKLVLLLHLRMEGKFYFYDQNHKIPDHIVVAFQLDNNLTCYFCDTRKFVTMHLVPRQTWKNETIIQRIGPDPFARVITTNYLTNAWKSRRIDIKSALLEQKIMSGIGNIYASEILFNTKIHPATTVNDLQPKQIKQIIIKSRQILKKAIYEGGTTVKSYYVNYRKGNYWKYLQVYNRTDLPCYVCKTPIRKFKQKQRGTYFCPKCQKK